MCECVADAIRRECRRCGLVFPSMQSGLTVTGPRACRSRHGYIRRGMNTVVDLRGMLDSMGKLMCRVWCDGGGEKEGRGKREVKLLSVGLGRNL